MTENLIIPVTLSDGLTVEAVWYPYRTLCISTQAGCAVGCPFCASGRLGLARNLTYDELIAQTDKFSDFDRVTLSGIGEPLDNFDTVMRFINDSGFKVSVTTTGRNDALKRLMMLDHNGIMISMHAGYETTHKKLVPKTRTLDEIFADIDAVWTEMSVRAKKRVGFNYLLVEGVNDSDVEIDAFISRVSDYKEASVHLLHLNHVDKSPFKSPLEAGRDRVYDRMRAAGLNVRRANKWRKQDEGGCGTLWLKKNVDYLEKI